MEVFEDCEESKQRKTIEEDNKHRQRNRRESFLTIGRHADGRSDGREERGSEKRKRERNEEKPVIEKAVKRGPGSHPEGQRVECEWKCNWG